MRVGTWSFQVRRSGAELVRSAPDHLDEHFPEFVNLSGMLRLWRADHALKALVKRLLTPSDIPLAAQKDVPRKREPTAEASEARRLTPSAADHVLLRRLAEQRWTVEELRWVATTWTHGPQPWWWRRCRPGCGSWRRREKTTQ